MENNYILNNCKGRRAWRVNWIMCC